MHWWLIVTAEEIVTDLSTTYGLGGIAAGLAAFTAYRIGVALALAWVPGPHRDHPKTRLLLLRVFGYQARTERLFDRVAQQWRFHGPVQLIAGVDLAMRTVDPGDVLAFVSGNLDGRYVATVDEVGHRVSGLDMLRDPDGRFRVNEVYCRDDTWRATVQALIDTTDTVLMTAPLLVQGVEVTPGLRMDRMAAHVPPGGSATIRLALDTATLEGPFDERATLRLNDPARPVLELTMTGEVVPPVQVLPRPGVALVGQRGTRIEATVEIVNHLPDPVHLAPPDHRRDRLASELATVEDGRRYRLTLTISPDAPTGKEIVPVVIGTDSPVAPAVRIAVATYVRARVYTFPDALDLGALPLSDWKRSGASLAQTLMVYQPGGTAFAASFSSDVPGLRIQAVRGPGGDRWQATVTLDPAHVRVGAIRGAVTITTNDPEFPRLNVPLAGAILPDNAPSPP